MEWLIVKRRLTLFPTGALVGGFHHRKSPTLHQQDLNLRRIRVHVFLNDAV